jgi:hypothetical protein
VDADRLPSQKAQVLKEARRKVWIDFRRDLTPTRNHFKPVPTRSIDIDVNI